MEKYFTIEELAKYLNYSEKTIRKWVLNREIPYHRIHKTIRFRLSEIEKWVDNSERENEAGFEINEGGLFSEDEGVEETGGGESTEAGND